jgi:hypothetical protein
MLFYFISNHIGLAWLYLNPLGFKQLIEINQESVLLLAFYSLIVVCVYILSGVTFKTRFANARMTNLQLVRLEKINLAPILLVAFVALPISIAKVLDASPLLTLISGDSLAASALRLEDVTLNKSLFGGIKNSYLNIIFVVLNYASTILLVSAVATRRKKFFLLYVSIFSISALYSFSNVSKGFIVGPIYTLAFIISMVHGNGKLMNKILLPFALLIVPLSFFSSWVMGNDSTDFWYPLERLIFGNLLPQYLVVNYFGFDNLLYGATVPSWYSFGLHEQFQIDMWSWKELMGWSVGQNYYSAPSSFISEAHANYHFIGVFFISYVVFYLYRLLDTLIIKIKSETIYTSMMVFSSLHFSYISVVPVSGYIFDYYYWGVLVFVFYIYESKYLRFNLSLR